MEKKRLVYGPVPSRRLGRSLGVDLVQYKVCSYDCVYCQIGRTTDKTVERKPYVSAGLIVDAVREKLGRGLRADHITLGGSGEPTLNSEIEEVIAAIKKETSIPVAVLTNGSLLSDDGVRMAILKADVVLPSLDAHDPQTFERINRPHPEVKFKEMAEGLASFRRVFAGQIWLEIFLVEGINATGEDAHRFKDWTDLSNPDRVHLNTAIRPCAEPDVRRVSDRVLDMFLEILGPKAEVAVPRSHVTRPGTHNADRADLLAMLARRPCTLQDMVDALNLAPHEVLKHLVPMLDAGAIRQVRKEDVLFYEATRREN